MTKQLLYIPNGSFITFTVGNNGKLGSLEEFEKNWRLTDETVLNDILIKNAFTEGFFERNKLPEFEHLSANHFEIVEA